MWVPPTQIQPTILDPSKIYSKNDKKKMEKILKQELSAGQHSGKFVSILKSQTLAAKAFF